jgi:prepilin-type N-terminal cleavage/methylation domain-containing protein
MKKLSAFTLMELLIGMIISSIVITFGYLAYQLITKQYLSYKTIKQVLVDASQFHTTFTNDLQNAEIANASESKIFLFYKNTPALEYEFAEKYIIRKREDLTDTFKIVSTHIKQECLFPEEKSFLQHFSFEVNLLNELEVFNFEKIYSSETLMNYKRSSNN